MIAETRDAIRHTLTELERLKAHFDMSLLQLREMLFIIESLEKDLGEIG